MENVIEVNNLERDYIYKNGVFKKIQRVTRAIDDITFNVKRGEIFGLLGPNGAGKTTTIKILTTLLNPTKGNVKVLGYEPHKEEKKIRPFINFIYGGERNLYWRLSAKDNLMYFSDLYKVNKNVKESRIKELLHLVGLENRADERVENFSKGMKQRLQIAKGLVNDPEILFLDEPTIGLDPVGAKELREIITVLKNQGKTILLTTHYMFEAEQLCDKVAFMKKGKIVALDTTENIKKQIDEVTTIEFKVCKDINLNLKKLMKDELVVDYSIEKSEAYSILAVRSMNPFETIKRFLEQMPEKSIKGLEIKEHSLEDVYIKYCGE